MQTGQPVLERQHDAAPPHGCGHIGLLPRGQAVGQIQSGLLGGKNWLFDEKCPAAAPDPGQSVGVQACGVRDEHHVIVCGRVGQIGVLGVQQRGHAVPQRAGQVAAQRVGL